MSSTVNPQTIRNGVDVDRLVATVNAIDENPALGQFEFRARTKWVTGGQSETEVKGFYGAGQEDVSRQDAHVLVGDEPAVLLGSDNGPNAVELVLAALGKCLSVGFVYNAAAKGITVKSLDFELEGTLDLQAFLGLSESVRPGYNQISVTCRAETDAPDDQVRELWDYVQKTSPVFDILSKPVDIAVKYG